VRISDFDFIHIYRHNDDRIIIVLYCGEGGERLLAIEGTCSAGEAT